MTIELLSRWYKKLWCGLVAAAWCAAAAAGPTLTLPDASEAGDPETVVDVPDAALRRAIEEALAKEPDDPITRGEMETLHWLSTTGVEELKGLEYALNLRGLNLYDGRISDLQPLVGLTSLTRLWLSDNAIADVSPLAGLTSLTELSLSRRRDT